MKALVKVCSLVLSLGFFLSACNKDIADYENDPRMFFQIPGSGSVALRDSLIYSFPAHPNAIETDTLWFNACIMGNAAPYDREIGIKVNTALSTAVEGVNFKIQSKVLPANAFKARIPIVIYKSGLQNKSVRLQLEVQESKDFKIGYTRYNKAVFIWGDKFLKPDAWDLPNSNYKAAFGVFSETKYAFILKSCNLTELPDPSNLVAIAYYNAVAREALVRYNSNNPKLTDENGEVSFSIFLGVSGNG
ncbi:DUF4843 domain-containing protein [Solitalea koreensis]|uniref:DUF4843 domain-containing protein n=1 Tax=Solitalea koreensis TaxID=543615 RepID=A0A521AAP4_9SPHI|nr:DUF4843 domain-containing protein [Solitalea koreensis]SMO31868.1 protein of unknown function [Solitalea koreensis]